MCCEFPKITPQGFAAGDDRAAPVDYPAGHVIPPGIGGVEDVRVPQNIAVPTRVLCELRTHVGRVFAEPATHGFWLIPSMDDARIGQQVRRPFRPRIGGKHVEPDRIHAQARVRIFLEDFVLHPPGAGDADRSRRGQEQHEPDLSDVTIRSTAHDAPVRSSSSRMSHSFSPKQ